MVLSTSIDNLHYLVAGKVFGKSQQRLNRERMTELLEEYKNYYDIIIIDSAPVMAYPMSKSLVAFATASFSLPKRDTRL